MHSTDNLQDGYIGSGTLLKRSINKYGIDNFEMVVLQFFDSREALEVAEKEFITESQLQDSGCMNLKVGGVGGFPPGASNKGALARVAAIMSDPERKRLWAESISNGLKEHFKTHPGTFQGRKHSYTSIEKQRASAKGKQAKEKNSQFGTKWITNEKENRKIKTTDQIPEGWRAGRKIKLK